MTSIFVALTLLPMVQSNPTKDDIQKLVKQLDDNDMSVRDKATKALINMWENHIAKDEVEAANIKARKDKNAEVEERTKQILERIGFRIAIGKLFLNELPEEKELAFLQMSAEKALEFFKWCLADTTAPIVYGFTDVNQQTLLAKWIITKLDKKEDKKKFLEFIITNGFKCAKKEITIWAKDMALINDLLENFSSKSWYSRRLAIETLVFLEIKDHINEIAKKTEDLNENVRGAAAWAIGRFSAKEFAKNLLPLVKDTSHFVDRDNRGSTVCAVAMNSLVDLNATDCEKEIIKLLYDPNTRVRCNGMQLLARLQLKSQAKLLADFLLELTPDIRAAAAETLAQLGLKEHSGNIAKLLKSVHPKVKLAAMKALAKLEAKEFAKDIAELLTHENQTVIYCAIQTLARLAAKEYTPDIAKLLTSDDAWIKTAAMSTLVHFGAKEYVKEIAKLLSDKEDDVRRTAAETLGKFSAKEYANEIAMLLKDKNSYVRASIPTILADLGAKEHGKQIAELLKDEFSYVRGPAAWALGQLNAKEFAPEISKLATDNAPCSLGEFKTVNEIAKHVLKNWGLNTEK